MPEAVLEEYCDIEAIHVPRNKQSFIATQKQSERIKEFNKRFNSIWENVKDEINNTLNDSKLIQEGDPIVYVADFGKRSGM